MQPARRDLVIVEGETWEEVWVWADDDDVPYDVTGFTVSIEFRTTADAADPPALHLDSAVGAGHGGIVLGGADGTIAITASAAQTAALENAYYRWDCRVVDPTGAVLYLTGGKVTVIEAITET